MLTFPHILVYFFNSLLSLTLKDIVLLLSKCLTYHLRKLYNKGKFIHKGLMTSSSLYSRKYLDEIFLP